MALAREVHGPFLTHGGSCILLQSLSLNVNQASLGIYCAWFFIQAQAKNQETHQRKGQTMNFPQGSGIQDW